MTRFSQLPVELHRKILKEAFQYSRRPSDCYGLPPKIPPEMEWIENRRTPSSFPFNAALTCSLWRDILAGIPECWTRIVFDVTVDPTPILNAFEWSNSLEEIEVLVFTSAASPIEVSKYREWNRVAAIVDALENHIPRCSSIVFDVMFEQSLPSSLIFFSQPAPNLYELRLEFHMDETEMIHENNGYDIPSFRIPDPHLATSFPSLHWISMDGAAFLELCAFDDAYEWFENLETSQNLHLRVARFRFIELDDDYISVGEFASCISKIQTLSNLHVQNLSVAYAYEQKIDHSAAFRHVKYLYDLELSDLHFNNVSKDFLSEFFSCATCSGETTIFTRCAIPRICQPFNCFIHELDNVIADERIGENGTRESSLHRVLVG